MPGAEDLVRSPLTKRVYVSIPAATRPGSEGALWYLDPTHLEAPPRLLRGAPRPFRTHGLSLWTRDGKDRLFVVTHPSSTESRIETLDVEGDELRHVESVCSDAIISPNDVLATGPRSFLSTSDHNVKPLWRRLSQDAFKLKRGFVVESDGISEPRRVTDRIAFPNGLLLDDQGTRLYVAATLERAIYAYKRDATEWRKLREISVPGMPDNLEWDDNGRILAALHPSINRFVWHAARPGSRAPSRIVRIDPRATTLSAEIIFDDSGSRLSAATVGLFADGALYLGGLFDAHVLRCR